MSKTNDNPRRLLAIAITVCPKCRAAPGQECMFDAAELVLGANIPEPMIHTVRVNIWLEHGGYTQLSVGSGLCSCDVFNFDWDLRSLLRCPPGKIREIP